ncbi:40s ribosomal s8 [Fusarium pseudoanthophilum]|uniref:40s ribosomal s8 n=1 Tax=Fusarium pseudoanthophilum TaxID=48495 RepID=A0A8H5NSA6_9HYPO|nr:40s ribosomal s8 [Fusarium pseudoanthophilum]
MNPCAPTFVPVEPSEDEFSSDEDRSSTLSSMEARHPDQDVRSPRARPRGRTIPSITIDPEGYESMFPALQAVNTVDPLRIRSPKMKKKQRSRRRRSRGKDDRALSSNSVNNERLSLGHQFSQSSDDEEENSKEPPLEYLKPTVYTPRKSLDFLKPDVYTPPASSHNSSSRPQTRANAQPADARARTRSPKRAWRPPTPHPDGRLRGSRLRRTPSPNQRAMSMAGTVPSNDASSDQLCATYGTIPGAAYGAILASNMASGPGPVVSPFGSTRDDDGLSGGL